MSQRITLPGGWQVSDLAFDEASGLIPGVVQDAVTLRVLMVGYLDRAAVEQTLATGLATFYSRSRQQQWVKGETSGNTLQVRAVEVDCDQDTLLLLCDPAGPTCHTGSTSCFDASDASSSGRPAAPEGVPEGLPVGSSFVSELSALVAQRDSERPEGSYTTSLLEGDVRRAAQKVGEEGVEAALAAVAQGDEEFLGESADLVFHLLVLLRRRGFGWADVEGVLRQRHR